MPIAARTETALATPWDGPAPATLDPPPLGQLLRPDGGGRGSRTRPVPPVASPGVARRILDRDVHRLLAVARGRPVPPAWARPGFAARVDAARHQLAPVTSPDVLIASFAREAFHARPWTPHPSAVRIADAIRSVEVEAGVALPSWSTIAGPCTPARGR